MPKSSSMIQKNSGQSGLVNTKKHGLKEKKATLMREKLLLTEHDQINSVIKKHYQHSHHSKYETATQSNRVKAYSGYKTSNQSQQRSDYLTKLKDSANLGQQSSIKHSRASFKESNVDPGLQKTRTFTLESSDQHRNDNDKLKTIASASNISVTNQMAYTPDKHIKLISGTAAHQPSIQQSSGIRSGPVYNNFGTISSAQGNADNTTISSANNGAKAAGPNNTTNTISLSSKKQPLITILIKEERTHQQHVINKSIRLINQFAIEAFLKQSQTFFMPQQQKPKVKQAKNGSKNKFLGNSQANYQNMNATTNNYQQMSPTMANNNIANIDMPTVQSLARQLQVTLPKNNDLRSKAFICHAKEQMLTKLFETLNKSNGIELKFKRSLFQHYKGFIGRGNNSQLFFQLFKQSRWWWNLYQVPVYDENGKIIMQHGHTSTQLLREDFKEHNFIFTQWKKVMHFNVLKSIKVRDPDIAAITVDVASSDQLDKLPQNARAMSPTGGTSIGGPVLSQQRSNKTNQDTSNKDDPAGLVETNLSNQWRIYAKMEANYHLSNKFALFFHMSKYYKSIDRDPFDVLPLTFHITKGTTDQVYYKFVQVFRQCEEKHQQEQEEIKLQEAEVQAAKTTQLCSRCIAKSGQPRSGLSNLKRQNRQSTDIQEHQTNLDSGQLSLPEFNEHGQSKYQLQPVAANGSNESDAFTSAATATDAMRGTLVLAQDQSGSSRHYRQLNLSRSKPQQASFAARKASPLTTNAKKVVQSQAANKTNVVSGVGVTSEINCAKCGNEIQAVHHSVSSLKDRQRSNMRQNERLERVVDVRSRFSAHNYSGQPNSAINHNSNAVDPTGLQGHRNSQQIRNQQYYEGPATRGIKPQGSLSRLQKRGIGLASDENGASFDQDLKQSLATEHTNANHTASTSVDQLTRLPAIIPGKQGIAANINSIEDASTKHHSKATVANLSINPAPMSPKMGNQTRQINKQQQSKDNPITLSEKFAQSAIKKRIKKTIEVGTDQPLNNQKRPKNTTTDNNKVTPGNIWIVKPGENSNRGNGITVCSTLSEIKSILCQSDYDKQKTFIVQKYIEKPALYNQRKFDIRCFAMLTLVNNKLKGFTYDNGYLRTSSRTFVNDDLSNKLIHLTNDAVQKKSDEYGRYESGNKLTFSDYQSYLDANFGHLKIDFRSHIFSQIKQIMTDTFRATHKVVSPSREMQHHTFEIYGFDFMLDESFKVYLIEVNTNPCLETSCPLLQKLITDLVDTGLRVALDPLYPPPNQQKRMNTQVQIVQWSLCFDEDLDAPTIETKQAEVLENRQKELGETQQDEEVVDGVEEQLILECEDEGEFD